MPEALPEALLPMNQRLPPALLDDPLLTLPLPELLVDEDALWSATALTDGAAEATAVLPAPDADAESVPLPLVAPVLALPDTEFAGTAELVLAPLLLLDPLVVPELLVLLALLVVLAPPAALLLTLPEPEKK